MKIHSKVDCLFLGLLVASTVWGIPDTSGAPLRSARVRDERNILNGAPIASYAYADQPYAVVNQKGEWVCVVTTGRKPEGSRGQFIISTVSADQGKTWSSPVAIEDDSGPEASWVTPYITPYGRIYAFYVYNGDNIVTLPGSDKIVRADTHGWYAFRYSDDGGHSWSAQRYRIPLRVTDVDRMNPWKGAVCHFWGIDKPKDQNGTVYFAISKLGRFFMEEGEGWIVSSPNLMTERDPGKIVWNLLPEGEQGIRNPDFGSIQEEFNLVPIGDDSLYAVNRTTNGFPACAYSHDGGRHWTRPAPMTYVPGGRVLKTPRACPKLFKTSQGRYLFWFHANGGRWFFRRNPVFLCGGTRGADGLMRWSQPELILFGEDSSIRISYPDLIEQDGEFWITETEKTVARSHKLDRGLLESLWNQDAWVKAPKDGLVYENLACGGADFTTPLSEQFGRMNWRGYTIELVVDALPLAEATELFSTMDGTGCGVRVVRSQLGGKPVLKAELCDGYSGAQWCTDPGALVPGRNHVAFVCDFSAHVILVYVNGWFCDGGEARDQGFGYLPSDFVNESRPLVGRVSGRLAALRLYRRPLRTCEVLGACRSFGDLEFQPIRKTDAKE